MIVRVTCGNCGNPSMVNARAAYVGVSCPKCGRLVQIRTRAAASRNVWRAVALSIFVVLAAGGGTWALVASFSGLEVESSSGKSANDINAAQSRRASKEEAVRIAKSRMSEYLQEYLERYKQEILDRCLLLSTATSSRLDDLEPQWKHGEPTGNTADIEKCVVVYTIYWESWVTDNGHLRVKSVFDVKTGGIVNCELLDHNGITKEGVIKGVFDIGVTVGAGAFANWLDSAGDKSADAK